MSLVNNFQYLGPFWSDRGCVNHQGLVIHQQCHHWDLHVTCTLSSISTMEGKLVLLCACLLQLYAGCLHQCCEGILLSDCLTGWRPSSSRTWRLCLRHLTQDARGRLNSSMSGKEGTRVRANSGRKAILRHVCTPGYKLAQLLAASEGLHELCTFIWSCMHDQRSQDAAACGSVAAISFRPCRFSTSSPTCTASPELSSTHQPWHDNQVAAIDTQVHQ